MTPEEFFAVALIAIALAMDCFAVSATKGLSIRKRRMRNAFTLAVFFGSFQGLMPLVGWSAGRGFISLIADYDHWLAFALLSAVGFKMIRESSMEERDGTPLTLSVILMLSIATSIDALAVGLSFAFLEYDIFAAAFVIGVASFLLSVAGFFLGSGLGSRFGKRMEVLGGIILLCIGVKILIEHMA